MSGVEALVSATTALLGADWVVADDPEPRACEGGGVQRTHHRTRAEPVVAGPVLREVQARWEAAGFVVHSRGAPGLPEVVGRRDDGARLVLLLGPRAAALRAAGPCVPAGSGPAPDLPRPP